MVLAIILVTFLIRLIFLKRSIENEKRILSNGGKEFGVENDRIYQINVLVLGHLEAHMYS
ncbi:membrane protein [Streptococcus pneumoniae]|nr:membrane protein [Streptococcus pneumoniae]